MVSFAVSPAANNRSVTPDEASTVAQQFGGFSQNLTRANRHVVDTTITGMGRTVRRKGPDGSWRDNNGKLCPAPGENTYKSGPAHASSPMTVAPE